MFKRGVTQSSFILLIGFIFCTTSCSTAPSLRLSRDLENLIPKTDDSIENYFFKKLEARAMVRPFKSDFLKTLAERPLPPVDYRNDITQKIVLGFLIHPDYSGHFSKDTLKQTRLFLKKYRTVFNQAEHQYQVPKNIIASLLWVETRFGKNTGKHQVQNVYLSLAQAEHPDLIRSSLLALLNKEPDATDEMKQKVIERCKTKSDWAIEQLYAVDEIEFQSDDWIRNAPASYAGAFGMAQFIPSSYVDFAKSIYSNQSSDLWQAPDAILSVANFLHHKGLNANNPDSYLKALFEYNRSRDYGEIIVKIAENL